MTLYPMHVEREAAQPVDAHALTRGERFGRSRPPQLTAHEDEAALAHDTLHPDDLLWADRDGHAACRDGLADRKGPEAADHGRERDDERKRRVVGRGQVVEERCEADPHRDKSG